MGIKEKDKSLLEIAIELLKNKRTPQKMLKIVEEVTSLKGLKPQQTKEAAPQFILDFMQSGYFVYCGDDCWDLKERQPTSTLDKDGGDYEEIFFGDDEDVKKNELNDSFTDDFIKEEDTSIDDEEDDDTDEETDDTDEDDDIARELGTFSDETDEEESESSDEFDHEILDEEDSDEEDEI